jgi:hypothetical protein
VVGDADFADVVQRGEKKDELDEFVGQAEVRGEFLGGDARVTGHAVEVGAGLEVAQVAERAGDGDGSGQRADGQQFAGDEQGNELGVEFEVPLLGARKGVRAAGVEEQHAGEGALAVHRDRQRGAATLCGEMAEWPKATVC